MKNTHTRIIFCIKEEPILEMIQKEFSEFNFDIKFSSDKSRYKIVQLNVNTLVEFDDEDQVIIDGYKVQFEYLNYYKDPEE